MLQNELIIGRVPLFASLPRGELDYLATALRPSTAPADSILFREGDYGDRFYIVLDGQVEIIKALGTADERLFAVRGPGEFVGEMSLFERDGLRTASVRTRTAVQLLELSRADFDALLHRQPTLAYTMVRVLSKRLSDSNNATVRDLQEKNRQLAQAYRDLQAAQAQIIEKETLERELGVAREIQESMQPRSLPQLTGFGFGARTIPAHVVSGDFFDFIALDDDTLGIVVGDACGHGVSAALFMALTRSLLRAETGRDGSAHQALLRANRHLFDMNHSRMFSTVVYGALSRATRNFVYVRAGHEPPVVFDAHGEVTVPRLGRGQPLGILPTPDLDEQTVTIPPGGTLLLYTDGVTEAMDVQGTLFGWKRLYEVVGASRDVSAQALCDRLLDTVAAYRGVAPQYDDLTLVAVRAQ